MCQPERHRCMSKNARSAWMYGRIVTLDGCAPILVPCSPLTHDADVLKRAVKILESRIALQRKIARKRKTR